MTSYTCARRVGGREDPPMPTPKKKNEAAQAMARTRWSKVSKKDRTAIMRKTVQARWAKKGDA